MVRVKMEITLPDELLQALLQHVRDFDTTHDAERRNLVHIAIGLEAPNLSAATVQAIFRNVHPPFEQEWVFPSGLGEA
jgi:hypothetical protein